MNERSPVRERDTAGSPSGGGPVQLTPRLLRRWPLPQPYDTGERGPLLVVAGSPESWRTVPAPHWWDPAWPATYGLLPDASAPTDMAECRQNERSDRG